MKNLKKLFALMLILAIITSLFACSPNSMRDPLPLDAPSADGKSVDTPPILSSENRENKPILSEARNRIEHESNIAYNNILGSFRNRNHEYTYHSNYAGAYLNEEGRLVVLIAVSVDKQQGREPLNSENRNILSGEIKSDSRAFEAKTEEFRTAAVELRELAGVANANDIIFQEAKFPYTQLAATMEQLNTMYSINCANPDTIWSQVVSISLLDDKNGISFEVYKLDDSKIARLKVEIGESEMFYFKNAEAFAESEYLYAGQALNVGSIGYRARRKLANGSLEYGFVTAAHVASTSTVSQGGNVIGDRNRYRYDYYLDAAFIKTRSGYDMSQFTVYGNSITSTLILPSVGTYVYKEGKSTGYTFGKVLSNNTSSSYAGFNIAGLISADYHSSSGDSGCIVYTGTFGVVGIHVAGPTGGGDGTRYIVSAINVNIYLSGSSETITPY